MFNSHSLGGTVVSLGVCAEVSLCRRLSLIREVHFGGGDGDESRSFSKNKFRSSFFVFPSESFGK